MLCNPTISRGGDAEGYVLHVPYACVRVPSTVPLQESVSDHGPNLDPLAGADVEAPPFGEGMAALGLGVWLLGV